MTTNKKFTPEQVAEIRNRYALTIRGCPKLMAREYGVPVWAIRKLVPASGLSEDQIKDILTRWRARKLNSYVALAKEFGVGVTTIQRLVKGETYNESSD